MSLMDKPISNRNMNLVGLVGVFITGVSFYIYWARHKEILAIQWEQRVGLAILTGIYMFY
jgi:hypothetical protein